MRKYFNQAIYFATILVFTNNVQSMEELNKAEIRQISRKIGYSFTNKDILNKAFQKGTSDFEKFEHQGDKYIGALIEEINPRDTVCEMQAYIEEYTGNNYFAQRYQQLGLEPCLKSNADITEKTSADAMEALVGAVAEDYLTKHTNLRGQGRVFKILVPVVKKLLIDPIPTQQGAVSTPAQKVTAHVPKPAASKKTSVTLVVKNRDGNIIETVKCKGKNKKDAENNAFLEMWKTLKLPKENKKTKDKFMTECSKKEYTPFYS